MNLKKVIIAGAGPGDPELITLKAARYLQEADVILADRLASQEIIAVNANHKARIIYVGKQYGQNSSKQEVINDLMVRYALQGKLVVRLKGGDVSIFSNILDELRALNDYEIPYEIVPGITAALGAAAYAGIPMTARGFSNSVRFLTSYNPDVLSIDHWKELAQTDDTLVFYMSSGSVDDVARNLTEKNIGKEKLIAIVEQATTPLQKVTISDIYEFVETAGSKTFISPTLLIVGKVVALHNELKWVENNNRNEQYFTDVDQNIHHTLKHLKVG